MGACVIDDSFRAVLDEELKELKGLDMLKRETGQCN